MPLIGYSVEFTTLKVSYYYNHNGYSSTDFSIKKVKNNYFISDSIKIPDYKILFIENYIRTVRLLEKSCENTHDAEILLMINIDDLEIRIEDCSNKLLNPKYLFNYLILTNEQDKHFGDSILRESIKQKIIESHRKDLIGNWSVSTNFMLGEKLLMFKDKINPNTWRVSKNGSLTSYRNDTLNTSKSIFKYTDWWVNFEVNDNYDIYMVIERNDYLNFGTDEQSTKSKNGIIQMKLKLNYFLSNQYIWEIVEIK